ncbi:MAG: FxsA family protein [Planctomycetota bacterium]
MFARLLLVMIVVPLADLFLLGVLSGYMGWPATILAVIVSGILGAWLARSQSASVTGKIREQLQTRQMPGDLLIDGAMIFFAGGLLITPGIITDVVGLSILIPPCRSIYRRWIKHYFKRHVKFVVPTPGKNPFDPNVVDGEVTGSRTGGDQVNPSSSSSESSSDDGMVVDGAVNNRIENR